MKVILAVDVGSSSARCSAYRLVGDATSTTRVKALDGCSAQRKIRSVEPNTGRIQVTGDESEGVYSLLDVIDACVDATLRSLQENVKQEYHVAGLGFSTFVMNLVAVDSNGQVVDPKATISYACNLPEVANECRSVSSELGEEGLKTLYQNTGAPLHAAYALPQLRAFYADPENEELCQRIYKWQTVSSICLARWLGKTVMPISYSEASWTGLFNFRYCEWDNDALELLPCREALPAVQDYSDAVVGGIPEYNDLGQKNPYWNYWPELREFDRVSSCCRFYLGLGDGACANIGSKCSTPNRIAVTVGTSAAARVCIPCTPNFQVPPGLFCYRVDRSHVLLGGALTDGGSVVEWACNLLNLNSFESFQECNRQVKALMEQEEKEDTSSVTVVPFLSGERSTGFRNGADGCVRGLTRETTPAQFLKACMEGVMLRVAAILKLLQQAMEDSNEKPYIVVSGIAMEKNSLWRQMLANASGMKVVMDKDCQEGTSRGVAHMVAVGLAMKSEGSSSSARELMREETIASSIVCTPRLSSTEGHWARAAESQEAFIDAVSPLW